MVAAPIAPAFGLIAIDHSAGSTGIDFAFTGGASSARNVLSTIATSLITVAGPSCPAGLFPHRSAARARAA